MGTNKACELCHLRLAPGVPFGKRRTEWHVAAPNQETRTSVSIALEVEYEE